jgi:hypothetical protein
MGDEWADDFCLGIELSSVGASREKGSRFGSSISMDAPFDDRVSDVRSPSRLLKNGVFSEWNGLDHGF